MSDVQTQTRADPDLTALDAAADGDHAPMCRCVVVEVLMRLERLCAALPRQPVAIEGRAVERRSAGEEEQVSSGRYGAVAMPAS
jgi:hypothetical protein